MKESITKFDLEAAFKALDELDIPETQGIKANKVPVSEVFSKKTKFDALFEDYSYSDDTQLNEEVVNNTGKALTEDFYDIGNQAELGEAQEAREAEVAMAKLARIEKIVDLDAESPDDLLASYVGKFIIQCPQCMTLFYKKPEDVEASEEDPDTVNVQEVCQHCGNESGYTLIGKVGEATAEETAELNGEMSIDVDSTEDGDLAGGDEETGEDIAAEGGSEEVAGDDEEFDLTAELANVDLGDDEEEKTEESFTSHGGNYLLQEDASNMSVSADEFEELINSAEFKKPISTAAVETMLAELKDDTVKENLTEDVDAEAVPLEEGGLDLLGKTLGKRIKQATDKVKSKVSDAIDKFAEDSMTREEKADWILANALESFVNEVYVDEKGKLIPNQKGQKYNVFLVIGYKNYYSNGRPITGIPSIGNKNLVMGMEAPEERSKYAEADALAKGWSGRQGCGPAYIYLAKDASAKDATLFCGYYNGDLIHDQLSEYFETVKKDLASKKLIVKGGGVQGPNDEDNSAPATKEIKASEVKKGDKIVLGQDVYEVEEVGASKFSEGGIALKIKSADGTIEPVALDGGATVTIIDASANEALKFNSASLTGLFENLDSVDQMALETAIKNSLVESYANVETFKLNSCDFLNEAFYVNGTVQFKSGASRDTSYKFVKAYTAKDNIRLFGLNEKLGTSKVFMLAGNSTDDARTLMVESLKTFKK